MKVIAGFLKGREIKNLEGFQTRPPLELIRSSFFNIIGPKIKGARVLDLFSGSGSMGIEALSRGALSCTFVEAHRASMKCLKENLKILNLESSAELVFDRLPNALKGLVDKKLKYDLIFVDPPFDAIMRGEFLSLDIECSLILAEAGVYSVRLPEHAPFVPENKIYEIYKEKKYGISVLQFKKLSHSLNT